VKFRLGEVGGREVGGWWSFSSRDYHQPPTFF